MKWPASLLAVSNGEIKSPEFRNAVFLNWKRSSGSQDTQADDLPAKLTVSLSQDDGFMDF